jgi:histidinol dehydrogenase
MATPFDPSGDPASAPQRFDIRSRKFEMRFRAFLDEKREMADDVDASVRQIIATVRSDGDEALIRYSKMFDEIEIGRSHLKVSSAEIDASMDSCDPAARQALTLAKERIAAYHARQRPHDVSFKDDLGVALGWRWTAIEAAGIYVPGGTASYPSSVLMNAIPAKIAGVPRIVMTVPAPRGHLNPLVLAAARLAGVDEIYKVGGAQAIAALAYGTDTIAPVVKIVGPGNAYVAAAKRRVFGTVGIDMIAGPSEVVVVADRSANAHWIAADLLAQAEHDPAAQAILITDDGSIADSVSAIVVEQLKTLPRRQIAERSWRNFGAIILVETLDQSVSLVDRLAPEHLEIMTREPTVLSARFRNVGAIFLGHYTPEAIGDYVGGSNHVLPTARSARFSSGLNVLDFMKRTSILQCDADSLRVIGPSAIALGLAEGLDAHARSVAIRLNRA